MEIYTVWQNNSTGIGEKCLKNENGHFIGIETGDTYDKNAHYSSQQILAKIISVDINNRTGMYHLYADSSHLENRHDWKSKYIGCFVTVEAAHWCDDIKVYRCLELDEYFTSGELEILNT